MFENGIRYFIQEILTERELTNIYRKQIIVIQKQPISDYREESKKSYIWLEV
jgi:hypothetical protein